jgi:hypothetical protein
MTIEAAFDQGTWKSRVLEVNLPKSGVGMPIFVLLQDRSGKRQTSQREQYYLGLIAQQALALVDQRLLLPEDVAQILTTAENVFPFPLLHFVRSCITFTDRRWTIAWSDLGHPFTRSQAASLPYLQEIRVQSFYT